MAKTKQKTHKASSKVLKKIKKVMVTIKPIKILLSKFVKEEIKEF